MPLKIFLIVFAVYAMDSVPLRINNSPSIPFFNRFKLYLLSVYLYLNCTYA
ncbi:MAG: hypothetical protein M3342_13025 [Bacteroidota bacterium]|nr:hypothetical protein [Flavisolibacter sp.]MDQ3844920.1 hypothetical protein [Bacteroidota bacterium]